MLKLKADFFVYLIAFILIAMFYSLYMTAKNEEIQTRVLQSQQPQAQVLYFGAEWCEPCKSMREIFGQKEVKDKLDKLTFKKYDIDKNTSERDRWGIKLVPSMIVINKDGKITKYTGLLKKEKVLEILSGLLD